MSNDVAWIGETVACTTGAAVEMDATIGPAMGRDILVNAEGTVGATESARALTGKIPTVAACVRTAGMTDGVELGVTARRVLAITGASFTVIVGTGKGTAIAVAECGIAVGTAGRVSPFPAGVVGTVKAGEKESNSLFGMSAFPAGAGEVGAGTVSITSFFGTYAVSVIGAGVACVGSGAGIGSQLVAVFGSFGTASFLSRSVFGSSFEVVTDDPKSVGDEAVAAFVGTVADVICP